MIGLQHYLTSRRHAVHPEHCRHFHKSTQPDSAAHVHRAHVAGRQFQFRRILDATSVNETGQVFVFFILTVAAAEAAIGLAILVVLFRNRQLHQRPGTEHDEGLAADVYLLPDNRSCAAGCRHRRWAVSATRSAVRAAHWVTILGVGLSCVLSLLVLKNMFWGGAEAENYQPLYLGRY